MRTLAHSLLLLKVTAMLFFAFCPSGFCEDLPNSAPVALKDKLKHLSMLDKDDYLKERSKLIKHIQEQHLLEQVVETGKACGDWRTSILADSLTFRIANPEKADLLDRYWSTSGGTGTFSWHGSSSNKPAVDATYSDIIARCFGQDAFPVLAENLLYRGTIGRPRELLSTLLALRDERVVEVLTTSVRRGNRANRVYAILCIKRLLQGLPTLEVQARADTTKTDNPLAGVGYPPLPKELRNLDTTRKFPALTLNSNKKHQIGQAIAECLKVESVHHLRAMMAWVFEDTDCISTDKLAEMAQNERIPLARAWMAFALHERAVRLEEALGVLKASETEESIQTILDGRGRPVDPWQATRMGDILIESRNKTD